MLTVLTLVVFMDQDYGMRSVKTRLILAGLNEIEEYGIKNFSLRRVALGAQVSCAAPYRHFKDKDDFI
jgi:AcrR family transcriptional regulator